MTDRLAEIRGMLSDEERREEIRDRLDEGGPVLGIDVRWLLDEVERLRDKLERNYPWWRRDADGSLWAAPPTPDGAPEPDDSKWVRIQ